MPKYAHAFTRRTQFSWLILSKNRCFWLNVIEDKFIKAEELTDAKLELKINKEECVSLLDNKISK